MVILGQGTLSEQVTDGVSRTVSRFLVGGGGCGTSPERER